MKAYADSGFIVALHLQQQSSAEAAAWMESYGQALPFIPWRRLEVRNAIRLAAFQKVIDRTQPKTQLPRLATSSVAWRRATM